MTATRYLGYAHRLEYPPDSGTYYYRGDVVTGITDADVATLTQIGHSFESVDPNKVPDMADLDPSARPAMTHAGVEATFAADGLPAPVGPPAQPDTATEPAEGAAPPPVEPPLVT